MGREEKFRGRSDARKDRPSVKSLMAWLSGRPVAPWGVGFYLAHCSSPAGSDLRETRYSKARQASPTRPPTSPSRPHARACAHWLHAGRGRSGMAAPPVLWLAGRFWLMDISSLLRSREPDPPFQKLRKPRPPPLHLPRRHGYSGSPSTLSASSLRVCGPLCVPHSSSGSASTRTPLSPMCHIGLCFVSWASASLCLSLFLLPGLWESPNPKPPVL